MKWKALLIFGLIMLLWLATASALNLPPRTGHIAKDNRFAQFANVQYCGKIVSITVAHLIDNIKTINPEVEPLAFSKKYDIAIYPVLDQTTESVKFAESGKAQRYYTHSYITWIKSYAITHYTYSGIDTTDDAIILQGPGWSGLSGSGFYNEHNEFVGSASTYVGFYGMFELLPTGIITITNYYRIKELLDQKVCRTP